MDAELRARLDRRQELSLRVRRLLVEDLHVPRELDEIDPDTPLFGVGLTLDSIDAVDLLVQLEVKFGLNIPSDAEGRAALRSVNCIVDLLLAREDAERGAA